MLPCTSTSITGGGGGDTKGGGLTACSERSSVFVGFARGAGSMDAGLAGGSTGLAGGSTSTLLFDVTLSVATDLGSLFCFSDVDLACELLGAADGGAMVLPSPLAW
jgi:hypothetical protein